MADIDRRELGEEIERYVRDLLVALVKRDRLLDELHARVMTALRERRPELQAGETLADWIGSCVQDEARVMAKELGKTRPRLVRKTPRESPSAAGWHDKLMSATPSAQDAHYHALGESIQQLARDAGVSLRDARARVSRGTADLCDLFFDCLRASGE